MRVALLTNDILATGGVANVVKNLTKGFLECGYSVDILYDKGSLSKEYFIENNKLRYIKINERRNLKYIGNIRKYIKQENPIAIISAGRSLSMYLLLAKLGLRSINTKIIATEHGNPRLGMTYVDSKMLKLKILLVSQIMKFLLKKADNVVAVSKSLENILYEDLKLTNLCTIYNPVIDSDMYNKSEDEITDYPYEEKINPIIVTVGRMSPEKNHDLLVDSFNKIKNKTDANLVIVGSGELEEKTKEKIKILNLEDRVFLLGYKHNPYPYIKNADLFVLSSKTEACPLVICEALALGVNVVSTDCEVGPKELLRNGEFGILSEQNSDSLSLAILEGLNKDKISYNVDSYIEQFTIKYATKQYIELISS